MIVPGAPISHSVITPTCRENRGDDEALEEAVERLRRAYRQAVGGWAGAAVQPTLNVVLTFERPPRKEDTP